MTTPEPQAGRYVPAAEIDNEPPASTAEWLEAGPEDRHPYGFEPRGPGAGPEAGLGHDYDGPELRSGTPEYEALYAEYQAWATQPDPEAGPVPYALTPRAEAVLASWDRFHALERADRLALGEAEPEPEAGL